MKSWLIVATLLIPAKALAGSVAHPAPAVFDEGARAELLKQIEAARAVFLPDQQPPAEITLRYGPRLGHIKDSATAAANAGALAQATKDFEGWKTVLLHELHGQAARHTAEPYPVFEARKLQEVQIVSSLRQQIAARAVEQQLAAAVTASLRSPDAAAWDRHFDGSTGAGASAPASDGAVRADIPTGPARYDKIRRLLLSQGVSAQVVDLAIAEGIRQKVDPMIVLSVIDQESNFRKTAYNKGSGCVGLMQLAPDTAADMGVRGNLFDPAANIKAGVKYLNWIANSFFRMNLDLSDISRVPADKLKMILASYNWGIGNVQRVVRKHGADALDRVAPRETRNYIAEIPGRVRDWFAALW